MQGLPRIVSLFRNELNKLVFFLFKKTQLYRILFIIQLELHRFSLTFLNIVNKA